VNARIREFWWAEDLDMERRGILLLIVLAVKNQHFGVLPNLRRWEEACEITEI
jgi:hypothetical protein